MNGLIDEIRVIRVNQWLKTFVIHGVTRANTDYWSFGVCLKNSHSSGGQFEVLLYQMF
jgi:hypothetical protein